MKTLLQLAALFLIGSLLLGVQAQKNLEQTKDNLKKLKDGTPSQAEFDPLVKCPCSGQCDCNPCRCELPDQCLWNDDAEPAELEATAAGGWKKGPMPKGTWMWGGVVPVGHQGTGFYFADFRGDHVVLIHNGTKLKASEIAYYNNGLDLPPPPSETKPAAASPPPLKGASAPALPATVPVSTTAKEPPPGLLVKPDPPPAAKPVAVQPVAKKAAPQQVRYYYYARPVQQQNYGSCSGGNCRTGFFGRRR